MKAGSIPALPAILFLALALIAGCQPSAPARHADQAVQQVDLERYMGKWYEVASFPSWFQKGCVCSTAEYTLAGNYVEVKNTCRKGTPEAEPESVTGKAYPVPGTRNSQLKVQFFYPFKGDYLVIALDDDYQYAVVGHPKRKYLWFLSRTPAMDEEIYDILVQTARAKGYDVTRLQRTAQSCGD